MPEEAGWAVWSSWRGDRAKLRRIAAAMEDCFAEPDVRARVTVHVLDDIERFPTFERFAADSPEQSRRLFDTLIIAADAGGRSITATLRRHDQKRETLTEHGGVTLTIAATGPGAAGWAQDPLGAVGGAITRGSIQWRWARSWRHIGRWVNYEPTRSSQPGAPASAPLALELRNRDRKRVLWAWTALIAFVVVATVYAFLRPATQASGAELGLVAVACVALAGLLALIPLLRDVVLPAVEIAERTPGRRAAARLVAVAAPAAAVLAKVLH